MRVLVCGVRGSTPAAGAEFARYGGNTSCIAVAADGAAPRLVLDAGTGLQRLSRMLDGRAFTGTLLLGHLHWDHTHGLPFFPAGDRPDAEVALLMPEQGDAVEVLSRVMSPPHFPIGPQQLRGAWSFAGIEPGEHDIEGFSVLALEIPHKGGRTFGYRVSDGHSSLAYLSDHGPFALGPGPEGFGEYHPAALALADGVDLLVHDAQHTAAEFPARAHFGHSAIDYAIGLAERTDASRLLLFNHDPSRTDDALDALAAEHRGRFPALDAAREGVTLELTPAPLQRTSPPCPAG
jgi:phosphoribosyl 1,2-cyclic phosphodiesterase